jgi:hypothetical protein
METARAPTDRQLPPIQEWQEEFRPQALLAIEIYKTRLAMNARTRENLNILRAQKWEPTCLHAVEEVQTADRKTLDAVDAWLRAEICKYHNLLTATDYEQANELLRNCETSDVEILTLLDTTKQGNKEKAAARAALRGTPKLLLSMEMKEIELIKREEIELNDRMSMLHGSFTTNERAVEKHTRARRKTEKKCKRALQRATVSEQKALAALLVDGASHSEIDHTVYQTALQDKIKAQQTQEIINAEARKKGHDIWDQVRKACRICNTMENTKACSRCRSAFYCCTEHQRCHWNTHKRWCFAPKT